MAALVLSQNPLGYGAVLVAVTPVSHVPPINPPATPDWNRIQWVLLDMDGTLLDLYFDNYFWLQLVPERYGERRGMTLNEAQSELRPRFAAQQGTLKWYCTDHWSDELGLNIAALKHEAREHIRFLPGAEQFLRTVRQLCRQVILVTNAHLDAFAVKAAHTGLAQHVDQVISSHTYGKPKEHADFWPQLAAELSLNRHHALFVDDSLPVLRAAHHFGIGQIYAIAQPDTTQPMRHVAEFPAVASVLELLPAAHR